MGQDNLKYNDVCFKASHNSYDRDESISEQLTFHSNDPSKCGCSGLELDIVQKNDAWKWSVSHGGSYSSSADKQLSAYLQKIKSWMDANPGHRVIEVHMDIKNTPMSNDQFPQEIDSYIEQVFTDRSVIFQPNRLIRNYDDLVQGAQATGWPTLGELKGKIIFCFTGNESRKATYARTDPKERLCFADLYLETDPPQYPDFSRGTRVFMNYHLYQKYYDQWYHQLQRMAQQPGFLTRGYVLNSQDIWTKAQNAALNIMATDKVSGHSWAQNGDYPFRQLDIVAGKVAQATESEVESL